MKLVPGLLTILALAAPAAADGHDEKFHATFADQIGSQHGIGAWRNHAALQSDLTISFGGNVILEGVMTFDTPVGKSRIETADGAVMVFDGGTAYVAPPDAPVPPGMARFHLLTWPYFVAAPFKLGDPGTHMADMGEIPLDAERAMPAARLTFDAGTGDTPDDWYIVYRDPDTNRMAALAYIVTYGKDTDEAEKEPHAVVYDAYETVDGVALPSKLTFYNWGLDTGVTGEPIGSAEFSNFKFVEPDEATFTGPEGARTDAAPPADGED